MTVLHLHLEKSHLCQSHGVEAIVFLQGFIAHFKDFFFWMGGGGLLVVPSLKVIE